MIETFLLDDTTQHKLESAHNFVFPKRKKTFETKSYWKHKNYNNYDELGEDRLKVTYDVLQNSIEILETLGIKNYDPNYFLIDYHQHNASNHSKPYSPFLWHVDDFGATPYNTHTVVFYLRKDKTLKGGDLLYLEEPLPDNYDDTNMKFLFNTFLKLKDRIVAFLQPMNKKKIKVKKIVGKEALYFPGNMLHKPGSITGFGCRDIIVVFIKRTHKLETKL